MRSFVGLLSLAVLVGFVVMAVSSGDSHAIPAFARKYETSCQTCHTAFPVLTPFGEAFRRNGYRFPQGMEADFEKDKSIPLGAEGYKKMFPRAVWPGHLPKVPPLAVIAETELSTLPHEQPHVQFDQFGGTFEVLAAGTLGGTFSFFGEVPVETEEGAFEVGIERLYAVVKPGTQPVAMMRIGRFEPGLTNVTEHRDFLGDYWLLARSINERADETTGPGNAFALEPSQQGFELTGTPGGRFAYTAGLVEGGGGDPNEAKDYYGRAEYKAGGMRLDGVETGESSALSSPKPWLDNSVTFGAFGYRGTTALAADTDDKFSYVGGDVYANAANLLFRGGYAREHHDTPFADTPDTQADVDHIFAQVQHVLYPWLLPTVRYERYSSTLTTGGTSVTQADTRIIPGIVALLRANVRVLVKADMEKHADEKMLVDEVTGSFSIVF